MLGFASGDADELGSLEGEAHHHGDADQGGKAAHEGRVADRPVLEARRRVAREDSEDHREARADEEDHGYDLEEREPVFRLAEAFYGYVVEREYEREEKCAPECSGHVGEPPAHDELGGHKVDCDRNGPVVAVVPAEGEAEAIRKVQQALADSLEMLNKSAPSDQVIKLKSIEAMQKVADGKATKIIIPSEMQGLVGLANGIVEGTKE